MALTDQEILRRQLLSGGGTGTVGGATTAKATPSLAVVENTTTSAIANTITNAKHISIFIKSGTGTILGQPVDTAIATIEFPFLERGWNDVAYTVDPNSTFVVLTAS